MATALAGVLCQPVSAQGSMANGENHTGTIATGQEHTWTFQANSGDAIALAIGEVTDTNGYFNPWIRLRNPSGTQVASATNYQTGYINLTAAATGTYTVLVASGDTNRIGIGSYTLTLLKSPGAFAVPSGDEGGAMTNGANHSGTIHLGDLDGWTFQANAGDRIALAIGELTDTNGYLNPWIRLRAPDGTQIGNGTNYQTGYINAVAQASGTYTVLVASGDSHGIGIGTYRLTLLKTPGSFVVPSGDEGGAMTNGANHSGTISLGDLDGWTFEANAGDQIALALGELTDSNGYLNPWIRLRAPDGTQIGSDTNYQTAYINVIAQASGTYTVLVTSGDTHGIGLGTYRLTLLKTPGDFVIPTGDDGGAMTNGANHTGAIHLGDLDGWTFQANAGDRIALAIGELTDTNGYLNPWIRLRAPDGTQIGNGTNYQTAYINATAQASGIYTVLVASGDTHGVGIGTYTLTLAKTPGSFVVPSGDQGGAMTNGENHTGQIHLGDLDQWTFEANAGDSIALAIGELTDTNGYFNPWIRLRAPDGLQVGNGTNYRAGYIHVVAAASGTYTVLVASGDTHGVGIGSYTLTLAKTPGMFIVPSGDQGGQLSASVSHSGVIFLADIDQWTLYANAGESISLVASKTSGNDNTLVPHLRLLSPSGAQLASNWGYTTAQINITAPQAGIYTVLVMSGDTHGEGVGGYNLTSSHGGTVPPTCNYSLSSPPGVVSAGGGTASITVTAGAGCGWSVTNVPAWITIVSGVSGTGSGTVSLNIQANPNSAQRSATMTVAGQPYTITQAAASCTLTLSSSAVQVNANGTTGSFNITTASGCAWTVVAPDSWAIVTSATSGSGNATVNFTVQSNPNAAQRVSTITVNGQPFVITQAGTCSYTLSATSLTMGSAGGPGSFNVTTASGCAWTVVAPDSWAVVTSATSGSGNATVNFTVQSNPNAAQRVSTITVNGQPFVITQAGTCSYTLSATSLNVGSAGGPGSFNITTASGCAWSATSPTSWIVLTNGSGTGSGTVSFTVLANQTTSQRTATLSVAGQSFVVTQAAATCTITFSSPVVNIGANGGTITISITVSPSGCAWSVAPLLEPWIILVGSGSGTGNGSVTFLIQVHTGSAARTGSLVVNGQTLLISQAGATGCTYTLSTPSLSMSAAGGTGSVNVTATGSNCSWTATAPDSWVTITAGGAGNGNGTVSFSVLANPSTTARTSILTIAGVLFTISQPGSDCSFAFSVPSLNVGANGGTSSFQITATPSHCTWNFTAPQPWITITSGASGSGSGTVSFNVQANPTTSARSANFVVGGQTLVLTQAAAACSYSLAPSSAIVQAAGGSVTVNVNVTGTGCNWTSTSPESWAQITAGASVNGSGTVTIQVLGHPGPSTRYATLTIAGLSFALTQHGTQSGNQSSGLRFVPLEPCRLLETRPEYNFQNRTGPFGPPFLNRNETRTFSPPQSTVCTVPASAKAYVVNVTLVPRGSVDYVTVWPAGEPRPDVWTVRSPDGQIVANSAIVKAGVAGGISVFTSDHTDAIVDISGYFTDATDVPSYTYYPLTPCRVLDTRIQYRTPPGPFGPPTMSAGQTRSFQIPATPYCQIPQGAKAYSVTLTVVPPSSLAFLTAWPSGGTQPNVSSINSPAGRILANSVILPANQNGSVDVYVFNQSDVLIDITGYFAPDDGAQGLYYFPVTQCRVHDSQFADDAVKTMAVPGATGCSGIPATAKGYAANVTAVPGGSPMPFLTLYPSGQSRPNASTLNAFEGQTVSNSTIVPTGTSGAIDVYAFRRTRVVLELSGYFGRTAP